MSAFIENDTMNTIKDVSDKEKYHVERMKRKKINKLLNARKWAFIIIGILSILCGIIANVKIEYIRYGGEAFTGIQNTAAQTATAVNRILIFGGLILIVVGATIQTKQKD